MHAGRSEPFVIGGIPGTKVFYLGVPLMDLGIRVEGVVEAKRLLEILGPEILASREIIFKGVEPPDVLFFSQRIRQILSPEVAVTGLQIETNSKLPPVLSAPMQK